MNPSKLKQEFNDQIKELDSKYRDGLRAKETWDTPYFQSVKELVDKEVSLFNEMKLNTSYTSLVQASSYKTKEGQVVTENAEDIRMRLALDEAYIRGRKELISMMRDDVQTGMTAAAELNEIKSKKGAK